MKFEEIMDTVLSQLTELGSRRQREEDGEMARLVNRRMELSGGVLKLRAGMDGPTRRLVDEYLDIMESIHGRQLDYLYRQGAKDCVRILKKLEVL